MENEFTEFEYLVDAIKALPTIGTKNARKIAFFLLKKDEYFIREFIKRIQTAKEVIKTCSECHNWTTKSGLCEICANTNRDTHKLCIVATVDDLWTIESCGAFNGIYHVLGGELSKQKNIDINMLNLDSLKSRIQNKVSEVLIATNFTIDGELTANYLKLYLKDLNTDIFRIAFGLPVNSSIDFADEMTLRLAIENKNKIK